MYLPLTLPLMMLPSSVMCPIIFASISSEPQTKVKLTFPALFTLPSLMSQLNPSSSKPAVYFPLNQPLGAVVSLTIPGAESNPVRIHLPDTSIVDLSSGQLISTLFQNRDHSSRLDFSLGDRIMTQTV